MEYLRESLKDIKGECKWHTTKGCVSIIVRLSLFFFLAEKDQAGLIEIG